MTREEEIDALMVDCYDEDEATAAWEIAFEDGVQVPFEAALLGTPVTVLGFRAAASNTIQCQVQRDKTKRWIGVEDLDKEGLPADMLHYLDLYQSYNGDDEDEID